jgi:hypothetical protein
MGQIDRSPVMPAGNREFAPGGKKRLRIEEALFAERLVGCIHEAPGMRGPCRVLGGSEMLSRHVCDFAFQHSAFNRLAAEQTDPRFASSVGHGVNSTTLDGTRVGSSAVRVFRNDARAFRLVGELRSEQNSNHDPRCASENAAEDRSRNRSRSCARQGQDGNIDRKRSPEEEQRVHQSAASAVQDGESDDPRDDRRTDHHEGNEVRMAFSAFTHRGEYRLTGTNPGVRQCSGMHPER